MNPDQIPARVSGLIWREVDDGTVVVTPNAGQVRVLNKVGASIWELMDGRRTVGDIEARLVEQYQQIPPEQIRRDLRHFLADLTERELLVWQETSSQ